MIMVYNGKLSLAVGKEKCFRDCKSYVIEDRLSDIIVLLYEAANTLRIEREAREEAARKREEEERQPLIKCVPHRRHPRHGSHRAIAYKSPSSAAAAAVSALSSAVCCGRTIGTQMPHA